MTEVVERRAAGLRALLDQSLRVTLPDGRTVVGTLQCADKQGNLVLHDSMDGSARKIGLVLVLRAHRVRVEALSEAAAAASSAAGTA